MNEHDLTGLEADLQRLKPAEAPPAVMARLVVATESSARPPLELPKREASLWELWSPLLRWLAPAAAVLGVVFLAVTRSTTAPKSPIVPAMSNSPLKADDVQLARQLVGAFDAVAELPGGETVRFRCHEWTDQMTLRDAARGIEVVQSTPSFEVVRVRFETY